MTNQPAPVHQDNLLGVCHAIGDAFGFNPLYLRLVFMVAVMLNAQGALIAYAVGAAAVLLAKLATFRSTRRRQPLLTNV